MSSTPRIAADRTTSRVLLFNGDLESLILWRLLHEPPCLYVHLGHRNEQRELGTILTLQSKVGLLLSECFAGLHFGSLERADGHIPYRNLLLAIIGATYAPTVYLGARRGDVSRDRSGAFFEDSTDLLGWLERTPVEVAAPFRSLTKTQLVKRYLSRFRTVADRRLLLLTRSCHEGGPIHCGHCPSCFGRWVAMTSNGVEEEYAVDPAIWGRAKGTGTLQAAQGLLQTEWREWPGIAINHLGTARALRRSRRR